MRTKCGRWLEQIAGRYTRNLVEIAQRREIIEDPKASTVSRCNQITALDHQIVNRNSRHIERQRVPALSIIEGDVDPGLGASEQQASVLRIFANHVNIRIVGNSVRDLLPD